MQSKLLIDLSQGRVEIEGDADLIREIYRDRKDRLLSEAPPGSFEGRQSSNGPEDSAAAEPRSKSRPKRRSAPRRKAEGEDGSPGISPEAPKLDKNLDTVKLGAFYSQFTPKNNSDKILIFLKFITEELGMEKPNTDQVYTCFKKTGEKIPNAYPQAFYTMAGRHGYIDYRSAIDIDITIAGDNHFNHELKKAAE